MFSPWAKHISETSSEMPKVFNLWAEQATEKSSRAAQSVLVLCLVKHAPETRF